MKKESYAIDYGIASSNGKRTKAGPFVYFLAVLKETVEFRTLLICAEGARLLENAIAFSSCVGSFEDVNQCPAGGRDRGDRPRRCFSTEE